MAANYCFLLLNVSSSPAFSVYARQKTTKNVTVRRTKPKLSADAKRTSVPQKDVIFFGAGAAPTTWTALPPKDDASQGDAWFESRRVSQQRDAELRQLLTPDDFLEFSGSHESSSGKDKEEGEENFQSLTEADLLREAEEELAELEKTHGVLDKRFSPGDQNPKPSLANVMEEEGNGRGASSVKEGYLPRFTDIVEDDDVPEVSEKGVPAVMRCFDRAKIYVKAGDGGNGVVAFRREKFVPFGGPSGGSGGKGGNVYIEADGSMNSLLPFRKTVHFRAGRGSHGLGKCQDGARGQDIVIKVAPGTLVREASEETDGNVLLELTTAGQRALLLPGGRGGRGNASFKTGRNKAPQIAENGEEGIEMWLDLELKLVADVGIVGVPNAGKSTLLSVISAAQPAIANYPFTTLLPNLGIVSLDYDATMVVADLPGLLEGAHLGFGLGHEFLRHTERCRVLVHIVDGTSHQPEYEFDAVHLELELFSPELAQKPYIVAYNKMDIPEASERWKLFEKNMQERGIQPLCMSAATKSGTMEVICAAYDLLKNQIASIDKVEGSEVGELNDIGEMVKKQRSAPLNDFEISYDNETETWNVCGAGLERFTQMTNWEYFESIRRFQHVLEACGVDKSLRKRGVKEGDTVIVGQMELIWHDSRDLSQLVNRNASTRGSRHWPH
eukprot:Gb_36197 [translate_table: standard]